MNTTLRQVLIRTSIVVKCDKSLGFVRSHSHFNFWNFKAGGSIFKKWRSPNLSILPVSQEIPSDLKISEKMWSRLLVICGKCWTMSRLTVKWRFLPELSLLYFIWCSAINQLNPNWAIGYSSLATCAPFTVQSELVCVAMAKALGHGPFLKLAHGPFLISPACTLKWIKLWSG